MPTTTDDKRIAGAISDDEGAEEEKRQLVVDLKFARVPTDQLKNLSLEERRTWLYARLLLKKKEVFLKTRGLISDDVWSKIREQNKLRYAEEESYIEESLECEYKSAYKDEDNDEEEELPPPKVPKIDDGGGSGLRTKSTWGTKSKMPFAAWNPVPDPHHSSSSSFQVQSRGPDVG